MKTFNLPPKIKPIEPISGNSGAKNSLRDCQDFINMSADKFVKELSNRPLVNKKENYKDFVTENKRNNACI